VLRGGKKSRLSSRAPDAQKRTALPSFGGALLPEKKRERRVVLGTSTSAPRELPDELLRAFKDWCASPEMQVMSASFMAVLNQN
jgi:hypothetical protein